MAEPYTERIYWGRHKGRVNLNFNSDRVQRGSVAYVTACEYTPAKKGEVISGDPAPTPWVTGAADITVSDVCPHINPNGVGFVVNIEWDEPLPIVTDITIFDPPKVVSLDNLVEV